MDGPQIGRLWQVDPLADKYVYGSTYAFSENKVINGVELEGLERAPAPYNSYEVAKSKENIKFDPKSQTIGRKVFGTAGKYGLIVVGIATGNPAAIILVIPSLGLTASQDIALAKKTDNKPAQKIPTSSKWALVMVVDKLVEAATCSNTNGAFQTMGEFAESVYNISQ